jgi:hypothetical protein
LKGWTANDVRQGIRVKSFAIAMTAMDRVHNVASLNRMEAYECI